MNGPPVCERERSRLSRWWRGLPLSVRLLILPGLFPFGFLVLVGLLSRLGYIPDAGGRLEPVEMPRPSRERVAYGAGGIGANRRPEPDTGASANVRGRNFRWGGLDEHFPSSKAPPAHLEAVFFKGFEKYLWGGVGGGRVEELPDWEHHRRYRKRLFSRVMKVC